MRLPSFPAARLTLLLLAVLSAAAQNESHPYYPGFHARPRANWNNDPNGMRGEAHPASCVLFAAPAC